MADPYGRLVDAALRLAQTINHCLPANEQVTRSKIDTPADYLHKVERQLLGRRLSGKACTRTS